MLKEYVSRTLRFGLFAATASLLFSAPPKRLVADSSLVASNAPPAPAHGNLEIRLQTHLTSYSSRAGTRFQSVVIRSFEVNGQVVIPMDSVVSGHVVKAKSVGMGFWRDRASLTLAFDEYTAPNGRVYPLDAKLVSLDNALERVNNKGEIRGIIAASNPNNFIFGVWGVPSMDQFSRSLIGLTGAANQIYTKLAIGPIGAVGLLGLRCALLKFPEPEIRLPPGADMTLAVTVKPSDLANAPSEVYQPSDYHPSPALSTWLQSAPYDVRKRNGDAAGDVINVALVGSQQQVEDAFRNAGWTKADPQTYRNYSHMWGAVQRHDALSFRARVHDALRGTCTGHGVRKIVRQHRQAPPYPHLARQLRRWRRYLGWARPRTTPVLASRPAAPVLPTRLTPI